MADEKKPEGKPADKPQAPSNDAFTEIIFFLIMAMVGLYLLNAILGVFNSTFTSSSRKFTPQGILISHTVPISTLDDPIGVGVISINDTNVYDSPGGVKIGMQKIKAKGTILQGSVVINDSKYWYVDYDKGVDGWVRETDIAYLASEPNIFERILIYFFIAFKYIKIFVIVLSILGIIYIIYAIRKLTELRTNERKLLYPESSGAIYSSNPVWENILAHTESLNENDWRQAILEADILLSRLLDELGLPGETMGEKLQAVEKSDFTTVDNAWEAHKIRNQIAHEGKAFPLSKREARRVIELYSTVFSEFQII